MTWSARARTDCGIVRLSAFAVFRLITSSNFVGCSTGKSAGLVPPKNLVHIDGGLARLLGSIGPIRHEKPGFHLFHSVGHRWKPVLSRQLACSLAARDDEGVSQPEYPVGSLPNDCLERAVELTDGADLHRKHVHFERAGHGLRVSHLDREDRIA